MHILGYPNAVGFGNSLLHCGIAESEKYIYIFKWYSPFGVKKNVIWLKSENILLWKVAFGYPRIANPSKGNYLHRMIKIKNIYYKKVKNMLLKYIQTVKKIIQLIRSIRRKYKSKINAWKN